MLRNCGRTLMKIENSWVCEPCNIKTYAQSCKHGGAGIHSNLAAACTETFRNVVKGDIVNGNLICGGCESHCPKMIAQ
eukprot:1746986-Amphidinium_carterae.1